MSVVDYTRSTTHQRNDFVLALRAEAPGGTLSVEAALPLVTVAASLGELELLDRESEVSLAD